MGSRIDGAPPGPKTDRDHLMKDNLQSTGDLSQNPAFYSQQHHFSFSMCRFKDLPTVTAKIIGFQAWGAITLGSPCCGIAQILTNTQQNTRQLSPI